MKRKLLTSTLCCASLLLAACSADKLPGVYKIDVPQGNIVTQDMVDQLRPGMNKRQVSYVMGTPLVVDAFHPERWDYFYSLQPGKGAPEQRRVTLFFSDDTLSRIEGDFQPRPGQSNDKPRETSVTVTPPPEKRGFFSRLFGWGDKGTASAAPQDGEAKP